MTKPEPEDAKVDLRGRNMLEVLEALRGNTIFVKTLRATHVPRRNYTCNGLTLPRQFVEDNMEKLYRPVVLLTDKAWSLRFAIVHRQRVIPDIVFCGGWKAFAVSSNLAEGDQLVFELSAVAQFNVYIFNADGTPKTAAPPSKAPMKWSHISELPKRNKSKYLKSSRYKYIFVEERKASVNGSCGVFAKEEIQELPNENENDAGEYNRDHAPGERHKSHPSFFKRLTLSNFGAGPRLEIPAEFARKYGSRLHSPVKLQGIFEESLVCSTICRWEGIRRTRPNASQRLFLTAGWKEFGNENMLEVEHELVFTLVSDSFFVVRENVNPPY